MSPVQKTETILGLLSRGNKIQGIVYMDDRRAGESIRDNQANQRLKTSRSMTSLDKKGPKEEVVMKPQNAFWDSVEHRSFCLSAERIQREAE